MYTPKQIDDLIKTYSSSTEGRGLVIRDLAVMIRDISQWAYNPDHTPQGKINRIKVVLDGKVSPDREVKE